MVALNAFEFRISSYVFVARHPPRKHAFLWPSMSAIWKVMPAAVTTKELTKCLKCIQIVYYMWHLILFRNEVISHDVSHCPGSSGGWGWTTRWLFRQCAKFLPAQPASEKTATPTELQPSTGAPPQQQRQPPPQEFRQGCWWLHIPLSDKIYFFF